MTVKEAMTLYMRKLELKGNKGTIRYYKQYFKYVSSYIGEIEIKDLTKFDVEKMLVSKRMDSPNISNASLNKFIQVTKALYFYINEKKLNVSKLREKDVEIPIVSKESINKVFNYYSKHLDDRILFRNYLLFSLFLDTGLRLTEIVNVEMEKINIEKRSILITVTKTNRDRHVVFSERTQLLLKKFIMLHYTGSKYLFINFKTGNKLSTSTVGTITQKLRKKLSTPESISPHKWRHTYATNHVTHNGNLPYLTMILGHSNYRVTKKYVHPTVDDLVEGYIPYS